MKIQRYIETNLSDICAWNEIFNDDERIVLQEGFMLTGLLSTMFGGWLTITLLFTSLRFDSSYRNFANFTASACAMRTVPTLLHLPLVKCIETLFGFQSFSCQLFGFLETFLTVFEVEWLTHVCIERYVLALYISNGWQIKKSHYQLYFWLCVMFSSLYSFPPLFGIGRYSFDFQCTSCTFDILLPDNWRRYFVALLFGLRSIKSATLMIWMLVWARIMESKFPCSMKQHKQFTRSTTSCRSSNSSVTLQLSVSYQLPKNVIVITLVNLLCWTPIAIIKGSVLLSQLMYVDIPAISSFYVMWAMWIHWVTPACTVIALFIVDDRVRYKMFNLCAPEHEVKNNENKTD